MRVLMKAKRKTDVHLRAAAEAYPKHYAYVYNIYTICVYTILCVLYTLARRKPKT